MTRAWRRVVCLAVQQRCLHSCQPADSKTWLWPYLSLLQQSKTVCLCSNRQSVTSPSRRPAEWRPCRQASLPEWSQRGWSHHALHWPRLCLRLVAASTVLLYRQARHSFAPMVTLSPITVGASCPLGLCRATCTIVPSWMLLFAPTQMAFTSPAVGKQSSVPIRKGQVSDLQAAPTRWCSHHAR